MKPLVTQLKNGMRVIVVPQKGVESMTILVLTKIGSRYESAPLNGASHFIEHLMFKGTKRRPRTEQISQELDRYGAAYNAYTDKDVTGYYIKMDATHTKLAVDLLHDMLFHSVYDPTEMDRERNVIIEEISMYEDNPQAHVDDLLEEALYPNSTLGWNIAGTREKMRSMKRDELLAYRDAAYTPERMTVIVSGKIEKGLSLLLEKTFGKVKPTSAMKPSFTPFTSTGDLALPVAYQDKNTEQAQIVFGWHGYAIADERTPAAKLLAVILGGTMSSRLFIQIRERRGLCYAVSATHGSREDIGSFEIAIGVDPKRFEEAVKAIVVEVQKIQKQGVTAEELARAKDHLRGRTMLAFEDSAMQAEWYGKQWIFQGKLQTPEERMQVIDHVTRAQVAKATREIFHRTRCAAAVIGPFGSKKHLESLIRRELHKLA